MSERPYPDSIVPVRELRPSEDLSLLHAYELRRVFEAETVASLGLIEHRPVSETESFRPVSVPLASESREPTPSVREAAISPHVSSRTSASDAVEVDRTPKAAPFREAEVARRDWLLDPEPIASPAEAQPYGDDPVRMRELLQWFADGRVASSSVIVQRAAGDLVDAVPSKDVRSPRFRTVVSSGRVG